MLHLLEDVLGWVAVLIVSLVLLLADIPVLDPDSLHGNNRFCSFKNYPPAD